VVLDKIKAFYKKKYSGFWEDIKAPKNRASIFLAVFLLLCMSIQNFSLRAFDEKYANDADFAQRYKDFWGNPWEIMYPIGILFLFVAFYCIYRMRRKYKKDENAWPEAIVFALTQIIMVSIPLFSLYL